MLTEYDSTQFQTVQAFFSPDLAARGYAALRGVEPVDSYRPSTRTRGRGSKLYRIEDLQAALAGIQSELDARQTSLNPDQTSLELTAQRLECTTAQISALLKILGIKSVGKFWPGKRPKLAFDRVQVECACDHVIALRETLSEVGWM